MGTSVLYGPRSSSSSILNGIVWSPDPPDVDEAEQAMLAVAAHDVEEPWFADWLRDRVELSWG